MFIHVLPPSSAKLFAVGKHECWKGANKSKLRAQSTKNMEVRQDFGGPGLRSAQTLVLLGPSHCLGSLVSTK